MIAYTPEERELAASVRRHLREHSLTLFTPRRRIGDDDFLACRLDSGMDITAQGTAVLCRLLLRGGRRGMLEFVFLEPATHGFHGHPWPYIEPGLGARFEGRLQIRPYPYNGAELGGCIREKGWRW